MPRVCYILFNIRAAVAFPGAYQQLKARLSGIEIAARNQRHRGKTMRIVAYIRRGETNVIVRCNIGA